MEVSNVETSIKSFFHVKSGYEAVKLASKSWLSEIYFYVIISKRMLDFV